MSRRWWGLTARQTAVVFVVAALVGIVIALVLGPSGGGDDEAGGGTTIERVRVGSSGAPAAVWVFGFETLRFDPSLRTGGQLALQGFGDVAGGPASVFLYDAGSGRVGVLDATANELRELPARLFGSSPQRAFLSTVAVGGSAVWVAPDPGEVVRVDPASGATGTPIAVATDEAPVATGLVARGAAVFAATAGPRGVEVARIAEDTGSVTTGAVAGAALDGAAAGAGALWIRDGGRLHELDPETLALVRSVDVPARDVRDGLGGLVTADGDVWMLADGGAVLLRYDPDRDRFSRSVRLLDRDPAEVELPAALASDGRRVVAMVQRAGESDLAVRVVVHDSTTGATRAVDVPGRIAPGAVASSTRGAERAPP
jgi:hypothetical protein